MRMLRQELDRLKAQEPAQQQQVEQLEQRVTTVETRPPVRKKKSLVFFRGGYVEYKDDNARGFESFTDTHDTLGVGQLLGSSLQEADGGWYVGAGVEHSITDDLFGLAPATELLGEIGLEFKNFGEEPRTIVVPSAECALLVPNFATTLLPLGSDRGCVVTGEGDITMFTVSASPKIKFLDGSPIRPWVIPGGLDFHVISPPSDSATYLDVGIQFGAGLEFEILPGIKAGIDGRYHYTANFTNSENDFVAVFNRESAQAEVAQGLPAGTLPRVSGSTDHDNDFWTAGAYLGFSF
jgi:hypothetical protein